MAGSFILIDRKSNHNDEQNERRLYTNAFSNNQKFFLSKTRG